MGLLIRVRGPKQKKKERGREERTGKKKTETWGRTKRTGWEQAFQQGVAKRTQQAWKSRSQGARVRRLRLQVKNHVAGK